MGALSEMAVAHPTAGSFGVYAEVYLNRWSGFVVRYTYWAAQCVAIGGEAAWKLVTDNPHLFAAAIFVCSAGSRISRASAVVDLPVWAFQGSEDDPDFVAATRGMIQAIRRAGGNPRYTEYKGAGHDIWDRVFKEPDLVEWLFAQHR